MASLTDAFGPKFGEIEKKQEGSKKSPNNKINISPALREDLMKLAIERINPDTPNQIYMGDKQEIHIGLVFMPDNVNQMDKRSFKFGGNSQVRITFLWGKEDPQTGNRKYCSTFVPPSVSYLLTPGSPYVFIGRFYKKEYNGKVYDNFMYADMFTMDELSEYRKAMEKAKEESKAKE